jgi:hypothetical protein
MTINDLHEAADMMMKAAKQNLTKDGFLAPVAVLFKFEPTSSALLDLSGAPDKYRAMAALRKIARLERADAVLVVNDIYCKLISPEVLDDYVNGQLASDPEAGEAILVLVKTVNHDDDFIVIQRYTRDGEAICFTDKTERISGVGNVMINLIPDWRKP